MRYYGITTDTIKRWIADLIAILKVFSVINLLLVSVSIPIVNNYVGIETFINTGLYDMIWTMTVICLIEASITIIPYELSKRYLNVLGTLFRITVSASILLAETVIIFIIPIFIVAYYLIRYGL